MSSAQLLDQVTEELPIIQGFIPATGALTMGILISVCKDAVTLGQSMGSISLEACKDLNRSLAFHYTEWRWERGL